jgi:hypothetical protein
VKIFDLGRNGAATFNKGIARNDSRTRVPGLVIGVTYRQEKRVCLTNE